MPVMGDVIDLLERAVYGMNEVDHALALPAGTAQRWIDGYARNGRVYPPVVREARTGDLLVTWGEFVETRLLSEYRREGVPMTRLRPTVDRLRHELNVKYPLAKAFTWLKAEGRELVRRVQSDVHADRADWFMVVRNGQLMVAPRAERFVEAAVFEEHVTRFRPIPGLRVYIDPLRQVGRAVVRSVPTEVIAELYLAGDSMEMIAELYDLDLGLVDDAIRYELKIAHAPAA